MRTLALVSTPLHLFHSWAFLADPEQLKACVLCFIDQTPGRPNRYLEAIDGWERCPFGSLVRVDSQSKEPLQRRRLRQAAFRQIDAVVDQHRPERLLVGNDRRVEFLYAHHRASMHHGKVQTVYVDDGVYSYLLSPALPPLVEAAIRAVHRLSYGGWYDKPAHVGGSQRIDLSVLELPAFAHRLLRDKPIQQATPDGLFRPLAQEYCGLLADSFGVDADSVRGLEALVLLPRMRYDRPQAAEYRDRVRSLVLELRDRGLRVGFKHHPREGAPDPLGLGDALEGMLILPAGIAFEALVPLLQSPMVIGDVSSVLLTAKWMRPELRVFALLDPSSERQAALRPLFDHLGVSVVASSELLSRAVGA